VELHFKEVKITHKKYFEKVKLKAGKQKIKRKNWFLMSGVNLTIISKKYSGVGDEDSYNHGVKG